MIYRKLGKTDIDVSVIGFGCWATGNDWDGSSDRASISAISKAIDLGVNFFDVAPVYGFGHAEEVLGKAIKGKRDQIYIGSKCGMVWDQSRHITRDLSRKNILREIDQSLQRLNVEYLDLYQIHWPDPNTPLEETMKTLVEIKQAGKIRHIGVTNFNITLMEQIRQFTEIASNQVLYNMIDRNSDGYHGLDLNYRAEREIIPYCREEEIGFVPYSPLCQGLLTGTFDRKAVSDNDVRVANPELNGAKLERNLQIVEELKPIAEKYERPLSQLALNWLIQNPVVTSIIAGALHEEHVTENLAALEWSLNESDLQKIEQILNKER